ncbi:MAG TPA: NADH dehydrogenase (quinone) subunit D [Candidatus Kapabacteria bacterium]|jgi:NADH-quinone oxidoreductase subunit D|nr:NADH-quinone oxidoreductase subunit D [Ignavibacteria bacterium]HRK59649.1 NADH dehydrogenase (quinone) subunit D [Candidatus Kapabacteria bacterium]
MRSLSNNLATIERAQRLRQQKITQELMDKDTTVMFEDPLENDMVLNMGPQHPATHGVLRILLRLDGETIEKCVPELGYLHRGYEKIAENMTYHEYIPHTDRLDYMSPMSNNTAIALAIENAIGIEAPPRAQWIRTLVCEVARISSHLMAMGATSMDVGALTLFLWTFRERENIYDIFELICGARFTTSYTRIGGVANDINDDTLKMLRKWLNHFAVELRRFEALVNRNRIFVERLAGVGYMPPEKAISLGLTGPCLRGSGIARDLRRDEPYLLYNELDFDVITNNDCDVWGRYLVRVAEMKESMKILHQLLDKPKTGDFMLDDAKHVLPGKSQIYTKMEELISDFMLVNFGAMPPKGETYTAIESPKGELGFFIVSDGTGHPWKLKIRSPSSSNLQALKFMAEGSMISDIVAIIGSIDPVMGEADK